ncbi:MAG: AmmeMemoRadiSam system protein B, partial [Desulfamplus sp.]|nr:AmmeMemoRadiSam system protein B [Desulfamplus sp.]
VPHAGWFFSGSIACRVIASIALSTAQTIASEQKGVADILTPKKVDVVFVFGMHLNPEANPCVMVNGAWQTPFGDLPVHEQLAAQFIKEMSKLNNKVSVRSESPYSFPEENTIELQLPFIKYFFPDSAIVPVGIPPCDIAETVGNAAFKSAEKLGLNVVVLGSTDMTHYGSNYSFTPAGSGTKYTDLTKALDWVKNDNDPKAINAMCSMNCSDIIFEGLQNRNLCCSGAVAAAAAAAKCMGAVKGIAFDYTTSYDKHPGVSFVGYSGILFSII